MNLTFLGLFIIILAAFRVWFLGGVQVQMQSIDGAVIAVLQFLVGAACLVVALCKPRGIPAYRDDFRLYCAGILALPAALSAWAVVMHSRLGTEWLFLVFFAGFACMFLVAHVGKWPSSG